ncbi:S2-RNase [Pyrus ussuriensis x Pyrus communis]|uniref:S2-RNase n=1 Tax=Pyrus ussuriensis x Pyrus communis TaxID=2448454 RepID=A0A5N5HLH7_9ROSA|nr:S2-RNase [Pyrus ussuriensis x Pyrus communis]
MGEKPFYDRILILSQEDPRGYLIVGTLRLIGFDCVHIRIKSRLVLNKHGHPVESFGLCLLTQSRMMSYSGLLTIATNNPSKRQLVPLEDGLLSKTMPFEVRNKGEEEVFPTSRSYLLNGCWAWWEDNAAPAGNHSLVRELNTPVPDASLILFGICKGISIEVPHLVMRTAIDAGYAQALMCSSIVFADSKEI